MNVELKQVSKDEKEILQNLLEKYLYEFSQWDTSLEINKLGLYGYDPIDFYWTEEKRWAYFIMADGELAGFAMVNTRAEVDEPTDYSLAEFFVLYKYRRKGVGKAAFFKVLGIHCGKWQVKLHPKNAASVRFWNKVIAEYTKNKFRLAEGHNGAPYDDGTLGDVFFFES